MSERIEKLIEELQGQQMETIAVWIPATKQTLSNADQLRDIIDQQLQTDLDMDIIATTRKAIAKLLKNGINNKFTDRQE